MASNALPTEFLRRRIAGGVVNFFSDPTRARPPVRRSIDALIPPGSVAWRVHGDITTMMVGGVAALLLQMLHPAALAGVWDHSDFRRDMHGRLLNVARFIAVTTYGAWPDAEAAIERVRRIHDHVNGSLPDGTLYDANDPHLLAWVHLAGSAMFLASWRRFGEPRMSDSDADSYWSDVAPIALRLGAAPIPRSQAQADEMMRSFVPELRADERTRTIARLIRTQPAPGLAALPIQRLIMRSAVDLLPPWARRLHRLRSSGLARPGLDAATSTLASTLRWALSSR